MYFIYSFISLSWVNKEKERKQELCERVRERVPAPVSTADVWRGIITYRYTICQTSDIGAIRVRRWNKFHYFWQAYDCPTNAFDRCPSFHLSALIWLYDGLLDEAEDSARNRLKTTAVQDTARPGTPCRQINEWSDSWCLASFANYGHLK